MDEAQRVGGLILKAGQDRAIVLQSGKQAPDFRPVPNQAVAPRDSSPCPAWSLPRPVCFFRPDEGGIAETLAQVHLAPRPYLLGPRFQAAPQDARPHPLLEAARAGLVGRNPLRSVLPPRPPSGESTKSHCVVISSHFGGARSGRIV